MAGTISQEASKAVYADALLAYNDPGHPCHRFQTLQHGVDDRAWQLPEPFNGTSAAAGIVFLGLNPSYNPAERIVVCPHLSGSFGLTQILLTTLGEAVGQALQ